MQAILALIKKQFIEILSSAQLRSLTLVAPLLQLVLFGFAANLDVSNVHFAVLDFEGAIDGIAISELAPQASKNL